ncbi:hypothetical protein [Haloferula sp. BvORR071]|uniref:hypothetical protein n=1 Tax=Haloferula sp. BvORR071 TaxID=1396141 RepID=UPI000554CF3B|nr:hypothetical protein [Haloferula sp. BvORR071]
MQPIRNKVLILGGFVVSALCPLILAVTGAYKPEARDLQNYPSIARISIAAGDHVATYSILALIGLGAFCAFYRKLRIAIVAVSLLLLASSCLQVLTKHVRDQPVGTYDW